MSYNHLLLGSGCQLTEFIIKICKTNSLRLSCNTDLSGVKLLTSYVKSYCCLGMLSITPNGKKIFCQKDFYIPFIDHNAPRTLLSYKAPRRHSCGAEFPLSCAPRSVYSAERENGSISQQSWAEGRKTQTQKYRLRCRRCRFRSKSPEPNSGPFHSCQITGGDNTCGRFGSRVSPEQTCSESSQCRILVEEDRSLHWGPLCVLQV